MHFNKKIRFRIDASKKRMDRKEGIVQGSKIFTTDKNMLWYGFHEVFWQVVASIAFNIISSSLFHFLSLSLFSFSFLFFFFFFFWKILCRHSSSCCPRNRWLYCITFLLQHGHGEVMCISRTRYIQAVYCSCSNVFACAWTHNAAKRVNTMKLDLLLLISAGYGSLADFVNNTWDIACSDTYHQTCNIF